ncbi:MAG: NADPH-dependent F420 reductase [Lysobacterales bacterium]|jgi:hypothetical protein
MKIIAIWLAVGLAFCQPGSCLASDAKTVAVIGTGEMGGAMGGRLAELGYRVVYGSRHPDSARVQDLVRQTGENASAALQPEAAKQGDIVVLAVPWPAMETVARNLGNLSGKIVIDVSMPFEQGEDGYPKHMLQTSSAELIQGWNPGARVVKAFGSMGAYIIEDPTAAGETVTIPVASDDRAARETVAKIVARMGLDPVDFGPLRMARQIENLQMIYMIPLVQNRPENWEFHFLRADHFGCYRSGETTAEGLVAPYDDGDLAVFPGSGEALRPCP